MVTSRLTSKAQTTVPQAVRQALGLKPGDRLAYTIEKGKVTLAKSVEAVEDPFVAFSEWSSAEDVKGYGSL